MKDAKSFKEIVDYMVNKHPELADNLKEMEKAITEKDKDDLCFLCGCQKNNKNAESVNKGANIE